MSKAYNEGVEAFHTVLANHDRDIHAWDSSRYCLYQHFLKDGKFDSYNQDKLDFEEGFYESYKNYRTNLFKDFLKELEELKQKYGVEFQRYHDCADWVINKECHGWSVSVEYALL